MSLVTSCVVAKVDFITLLCFIASALASGRSSECILPMVRLCISE